MAEKRFVATARDRIRELPRHIGHLTGKENTSDQVDFQMRPLHERRAQVSMAQRGIHHDIET
jgi:hypothetical protein